MSNTFLTVKYIPLFVILLLLFGCEKLHTINGTTMGTTYSISSDVRITQEEIDTELQRINALFSNWQEDSEVSVINSTGINTPIPISKEFNTLLTISKDIHQQTQGYFDVTIGALIDLWGFGVQRITKKPNSIEIKKFLTQSGFDKLVILDNTITKKDNIQLNFSAIAKGYAVDVIAELLTMKNSNNFIVEIGGEVRVRGVKQIGIERVDEPPYPIAITNEAIATSGDYRNFIIFNDEKFIHILNPFNGKPSNSDLVSVSVVHQSAMLADAYATALLAMGKEEAVVFIEKNTLKSVLIDKNNNLTTYNIY